ncbi:AP-3 complex subunit mu-like [Schistocerca gregaria]|uniref:AP-3 complex subunit mu-like n=1 Tax=Schistocerca gregaria TaxID=7010 RepID=UPI00211EF6CA|nr:AP-3 complex subunit mu-like [Schistocerca gregaria]
MCISSLFIINQIGEVQVERHYHGLISRVLCSEFIKKIQEESHKAQPVLKIDKYYFIHVSLNSLYFVAVCVHDAYVLAVVEFLVCLIEIFRAYFGNEAIDEDAIKSNIFVVYQLLTEVSDSGLVLNSDPAILELLVPHSSILNTVQKTILGFSASDLNSNAIRVDSLLSRSGRSVSSGGSSQVEIYADVMEFVRSTADLNGDVFSSSVTGKILCNTKTSDVSEVCLRFCDPPAFDSVSFHSCVLYEKYEKQGVIAFVPPNGKFKLMDFRILTGISVPISIVSQVRPTETGLSIKIICRATQANLNLTGVVVEIKFLRSVDNCSLISSNDADYFDKSAMKCTWEVGTLSAAKPGTLEGTVNYSKCDPSARQSRGSHLTIYSAYKTYAWSASNTRLSSLSVQGGRNTHKYTRNVVSGEVMQAYPNIKLDF